MRFGCDAVKRRINKKYILLIFAFFISIYMLINIGSYIWKKQWIQIQDFVCKATETICLPNLYWESESVSIDPIELLYKQALRSQPILDFAQKEKLYEQNMEDTETLAMILEKQANEEPIVNAEGNVENAPEVSETPVPVSSIDMSPERLQDFNYLLSTFYIVDSMTMIDAGQLNYNDLMSRSMKINQETEGPKVLIFHTHSQETFADSIPGDSSTSIVGIGEYLSQRLNEKGVATIHHTGVYDVIDGVLDRSSAYEYAEAAVKQILAENPSIEVVIDLHRDGVAEETHLVTDIGGKQTAKIMFFNGLSRTRTTGDIDYLYNPYIQDNLSFSFQMQLACESKYPGFVRRIYLRGYRYSLHMMPKSLLIEAGAQTNTVEEMKNAMDLLSDTLYSVLIG